MFLTLPLLLGFLTV